MYVRGSPRLNIFRARNLAQSAGEDRKNILCSDFETSLPASEKLSDRLISLFTKNVDGNRPIYGDQTLFQKDPNFKDYTQFFEYFHGDTGKGLGASHQTGWTGLVARLLMNR